MAVERRRRLIPETEGPSLDGFRLRTGAGIGAILHRLADRQALVGLFDGEVLIASARVLSAAERVLVQVGGPEDAARIAERRKVMAVAFLDDVKVQFPLLLAPRIGGPDRVFQSPTPENMWRLQRRRGHRMRTPKERSVWVRIRPVEGEVWNVPVEDLSVVGVGLRMAVGTQIPEVGTKWEDVQLHVLQDGVPNLVPCVLTVRRVTGGGDRPYRVGCALDGVPLPSARVLQRFVIDLELAARAAQEALEARSPG